MNQPQTILTVQGLRVEFRGRSKTVVAVNDISFQVNRGETLGIVGESGSGKSVTALAVMGLVSHPGKVTGGQLWFESGDVGRVDLRSLSRKQWETLRGHRIAMIFQEPMTSLNPVYTVGFQLVEAIQLHQPLSKVEAEKRAIGLLQEVKLLQSDDALLEQYQNDSNAVDRHKRAMLDRYPHQLSGGQLQRIMIAMAISCDPALLIADEPTTALDVTVQATILDLLRELRDRRGMGMMFITHDLGLVAEIADQVAVMYEGNVVETGTVMDIFSSPRHPYTQGLLTCRPNPDRRLQTLPTVADFMAITVDQNGDRQVTAKHENIADLLKTLPEISDGQVEERLSELRSNAPLLSVANLTVAYPIKNAVGRTERLFKAVNDVSFDVYPGETLGLVGESGCGKSTLARTLLRLVEPTSGSIQFDNQNLLAMRPNALRQLRQEMQIIFQNPFSALDPRLNVGDAVMEPLKIFGKNRSDFKTRAKYLLDRVGLEGSDETMARFPHQFSGGQRQRICIARALALNPKFIICDESVSALDVSVQAQVLNLLKELQAEFNLTYVFISHDLSVVKFMSDRIMVMNQGKIEELDTAEQIYRNPTQDYTKKLIASIPMGSLDQIRIRQMERSARR
jgi:peptide/nickel transport system ATP-binding protein